jgi:hypothetical protein
LVIEDIPVQKAFNQSDTYRKEEPETSDNSKGDIAD